MRSNPSHSFKSSIYIHHHSVILPTSSSPAFIFFLFRSSPPITGNRHLRPPSPAVGSQKSPLSAEIIEFYKITRKQTTAPPPSPVTTLPTTDNHCQKITISKQKSPDLSKNHHNQKNPAKPPLIITLASSATRPTTTAIRTLPPPHNHQADFKVTQNQYKSTKDNIKSPAVQ